MRKAQANVVAVALGVSLIVILLLSTAYLLSSTSVKTIRVLELLSEQAGVSIYINGSGYLVGNTRPEYIVVKDSSGNIEVYLAGDLGIELNKPFPELSGVVYGVAANGAVRLLKPAPHLSTNATGGRYLVVWPGWFYSFKPLVPYNDSQWTRVYAVNVAELVAHAGYLSGYSNSTSLYLLATVNFTETSIGWRTWRIVGNVSWTRSSTIYDHVVLSAGHVLFRVYSLEDVVFNVYACNTTSCTALGSYSVRAGVYTNISVLTSYPYILFNVTVLKRPLWPNWTYIEVYLPSTTFFSNNTIRPQDIIDATTPATTKLNTLSCTNFTKLPVLDPYPYTEETISYYKVNCSSITFSWVNWSSNNVFILGRYVFTAPKPVIVLDSKIVVNASTYPVKYAYTAPPTSTIMLRIEYNVTPWIGPARGAYITLRVYANGIELLNTTSEVTPTLSTFRFTTRVSIAGYIFNITAMSTYTLTAIVNSVNITIENASSAPFIVLVPSSNANVISGLINISEYKAIGWTHAYVYSRWTGGSRIIDVVVSQN